MQSGYFWKPPVDSIELAPATFLAVFSQGNVSGQCGPAGAVDDSLGAIEGGRGWQWWQTGGGLGGKVCVFTAGFFSSAFYCQLPKQTPISDEKLPPC